MPDDQSKFVLRIPTHIHDKLKEEGQKTNCSMNKIITDILADRYRKIDPTQAKLNKIIRLLEGT